MNERIERPADYYRTEGICGLLLVPFMLAAGVFLYLYPNDSWKTGWVYVTDLLPPVVWLVLLEVWGVLTLISSVRHLVRARRLRGPAPLGEGRIGRLT